MPALDAVEWEACLLEPVHNPAAERTVRRALGMVPPAVALLLRFGVVAGAVIAFGITHLPLLHVSPILAEMVALVVSQDERLPLLLQHRRAACSASSAFPRRASGAWKKICSAPS